jgi:hypothetical protein
MAAASVSFWRRLWYTRLRDVVRGRFDASCDWQRVVAEADLPEPLRQIVAAAVQPTRLWNREKVDVAAELIAHFRDGLEGGRTASALAADFGDPRQTAALVRRAKQRGRPLVWHVWHYGWITAAALIAAYLLTGLYQMLGRPTVKIDYLALINERAAAVPAAERAWPFYRDALLALGAQLDDNNMSHPFVIACGATPGDEHWDQAVKFLNQHQDAIAKIRQGASRPELGLLVGPSWQWFAPEDRVLLNSDASQAGSPDQTEREPLADRWLIATRLPHLYLLRTTSELLLNDCRRAVAANDGETALADVTALLGIARQLVEQPFLVNVAIADVVELNGIAGIREAFVTRPELWSDAQLGTLAHEIAAAKIDWRRGFVGESACFDDVMQRMYTDNGRGDGRLAFRVSRELNVFGMLDEVTGPGPRVDSIWSNDALAVLAMPAANMVVASRKEMTEAYHDFASRSVVEIETPLWEQVQLPPENELLTDRAGMIDRYRYLFLRILAPAHNPVRNKRANLEGERDGVLIGVALELYHREHGAWPKSLAELSPRWLPKVPVDRITGKALHYKIVDNQPLVYSVGVDRDDDGGRIPRGENGAEIASPLQFQLEPSTDATHDGDWVIWSPVPRDETAPQEH